MTLRVPRPGTRRRPAAAVLAALVTLWAPPAAAQDPEPLIGRLRDAFQKDYLRLGALLQTVADFQVERQAAGPNGFSIANFRVSLSGELDRGFGYFLQTSFVKSPAVIDARMTYRPASWLTGTVGQFKAPFSGERLISAASIDFVNRAQAVTALAPGRQIGLEVELSRPDGARVAVGAFNGNGIGTTLNDDDRLMYVVRASATPVRAAGTGKARLEIGANAAFSRDFAAVIPGVYPLFTGARRLWGGDVRFTAGRLLLSAEALSASLSPVSGGRVNPAGGHLTVGYKPGPKTQLLIRWDGFDPDRGTRTDLLIAGLNLWPTQVTEFQFNYLVNTRQSALKHHQLLVNFQLGF